MERFLRGVSPAANEAPVSRPANRPKWVKDEGLLKKAGLQGAPWAQQTKEESTFIGGGATAG